MTTICLLGGDGIGPEVVEQAARVLGALPLQLEFTRHPVGFACYQEHGTPLPDATLEAARAADAVLFGAVTTPPDVPNYRSPILQLRRKLDLYANVRPCRSFPHASSRPGIDLVIVRENSEGLYAGREREEDGGETVISERVVTRGASLRIAAHAASLAKRRGDQHVTVVHKANVIRKGDGLFRRAAREAIEAAGLGVKELLVDACAMQLLRDPTSLGTIVTTNMFGDILSDEAAMLTGSLGMLPSASLGGDGPGLFEPVHGSAPDIAGTGQANPLATFLSAALLLRHGLDRPVDAERLEAAVEAALESGLRTPDLATGADGERPADTAEMTTAVIGALGG